MAPTPPLTHPHFTKSFRGRLKEIKFIVNSRLCSVKTSQLNSCFKLIWLQIIEFYFVGVTILLISLPFQKTATVIFDIQIKELCSEFDFLINHNI